MEPLTATNLQPCIKTDNWIYGDSYFAKILRKLEIYKYKFLQPTQDVCALVQVAADDKLVFYSAAYCDHCMIHPTRQHIK